MSSATEGTDRLPPRARADAARMRVNELQQRRSELARGIAPTAQDVAYAKLRAKESLRHAYAAHWLLPNGTPRRAEAHRRVAAAVDAAAA